MSAEYSVEEVRSHAAMLDANQQIGAIGMIRTARNMLTAYAEHLSTHPHSPDAADSGRVTREMVERGVNARIALLCERRKDMISDNDLMRASLEAALAAQGQGEKMPVPVSLDRTHKNKAHMTLGFCDEQACSTFFNAIWRGLDLYANTAPAASPAGVPDGMVLVPEIATQAMVDAGSKEWRHQNIFGIWEAMLAAAPSAPEGGEVGL